MKTEPRRVLVVSFHDLSPETRASCEQFLDDAAARGVRRAVLLVIPEPAGGTPVNADPSFVHWLREKVAEGHELCLHGLCHRDPGHSRGGLVARWIANVYTQREGEFFRADRETAAADIEKGLAAFRAARLPVSGFVPPAWLIGKQGRTAAAEAGMRYVTGLLSVRLLNEERTLYAPTIVLSCRNAVRRAVSRVWSRLWFAVNGSARCVRVAVHPADQLHSRPYGTLLDIIEKAAACRPSLTYKDWLDTAHPPPKDLPV